MSALSPISCILVNIHELKDLNNHTIPFFPSFLMWKARAFYLKLTLTQCHDWMFKWKKSGKSFSYFSSAVTWQLALHLRASNCVETGALPEKIYVIFYSPIKIPKKNEGKISSHGWADIHKALNWTKNS